MIPVPEAYLAAIRAPVRTDRIGGVLALPGGSKTTLTAADFVSGTLTIDDQCVTGEELQFGCVYLGQAAFTLRTGLDRYTLYGATVSLYYEILLADGSWYRVPLGVYNITEAARTGGTVAVKAYDNAVLLDTAFNGAALQGTPYEILREIAKRCGLAMGQTEAELAAFCNSGESLQLSAGNDGCATYRDCVGAVAQLLAGFGTVDRSGALVIRQFAAAPCLTLAPEARYTTAAADYLCRYDALVIETGSHTYTAETDPRGSGLTMTMTDVPLLCKGVAERNQAMVNAMFAVLQAITYVPASVTLPGNPALECGDRLILTGIDKNGAEAQTLITHRVWKYHARQTVRGAGRNPRLAAAAQKTTAAERRLQSQSEQNRLIFYSFTNAEAVTLADPAREYGLARITFVTVGDTNAMFLAQILLNAAPAAAAPLLLTLRYYLNGSPIADYCPQQVLGAGAHTVALFYPFAGVAGGSANTLELRAVVEGAGEITIATGAVQATVTGQGMAATEVWDGTINAEEVLPAVPINAPPLAVATLTEQLATDLDTPLPWTLANTLGTAVRWQPMPSLFAATVAESVDAAMTATETKQ